MGADKRMFQNFSFEGFNVVHIYWILPLENETIQNYAFRISENIINENAILLGLSFGGMLAVEISKIKKFKKIFLISSAKTKSEIPFYFRFLGKLNLLKIIPVSFLKKVNFITYFVFGARSNSEKILLKNIVKNMAKVRKKLYWNVVTKDLADLVKSAYRPNDFGMKPVEITPLNIQSIGLSSKIMRAKNISKKGIRFANNNGILPATKIVLDKVSRKIQNKTNLQNKNPRIVIVSHQLDNTGAPFVAIDLAESI